MKQFYLFFALTLCGLGTFAQSSITMVLENINNGAAFKISAFEDDGYYNTASQPIGSTGANFPDVYDLKIKMPLGAASTALQKFFLSGSHIATGELDFYDNTNTLIYKINLKEVIISKSSFLSPDCPSCQSLTNEFWLVYGSIQYTDVVNKITFSYNPGTKTIQ